MGTRSLKAPLSPSEELTLRRIVIGIAKPEDLPGGTVARLRTLGLVDDANRLTAAGRERYERLTRSQTAKRSAIDDLASFLAAVQRAGPPGR